MDAKTPPFSADYLEARALVDLYLLVEPLQAVGRMPDTTALLMLRRAIKATEIACNWRAPAMHAVFDLLAAWPPENVLFQLLYEIETDAEQRLHPNDDDVWAAVTAAASRRWPCPEQYPVWPASPAGGSPL